MAAENQYHGGGEPDRRPIRRLFLLAKSAHPLGLYYVFADQDYESR